MSQSAPQLAFANEALRYEPCRKDKPSMRAEAESRTTLGILAVINERIVIQGSVASYIEKMSGHRSKMPVEEGYFIGWFWPSAAFLTPQMNP
jgi:hypothetical protein